MNGGDDDGAPKRCYYDVLDVDMKATVDEIRRAYKKMALKCHPDKNHGNQEAAVALFKEVQNAHAVLTDDKEREWYDAHRESILRGDEHGTCAPDELNVFQYFSPRCFSGFDDADPKGFYQVYVNVFKTIAEEECRWIPPGTKPPTYPPFGDSSSDFRVVSAFYNFWKNYQTRKTFAWKDEYKVSEMTDRYQRRAAERFNKKTRDTERREYSKNVQELAQLVYNRDPRVEDEKERQRQEAEAKEKLRQAELEERDARREANNQKLWEETAEEERRRDAERAKTGEGENIVDLLYQQAELAKLEKKRQEEEEQQEGGAGKKTEFRCAICKVKYHNEKQYREHCNSAKHKKKAKQMGVSDAPVLGSPTMNDENDGEGDDNNADENGEEQGEAAAAKKHVDPASPNTSKKAAANNTNNDDGEEEEDDAQAESPQMASPGSKKKNKKKNKKRQQQMTMQRPEESDDEEEDEEEQQPVKQQKQPQQKTPTSATSSAASPATSSPAGGGKKNKNKSKSKFQQQQAAAAAAAENNDDGDDEEEEEEEEEEKAKPSAFGAFGSLFGGKGGKRR